jgi:pimeloyl-ACP methyl ester carboxylesterase
MAACYEGEADFNIPSANKPTKTWYKVYGNLESSNRTPLIVLHGGPGFPHEYLLDCAQLANKFNIPVIFYDQLGCGHSTHLPEKMGDTSFWTEQLFLDELENLTKHLGIDGAYDILGHSWGGMLGARHATRQPKGLRRLVVSDSPSNMITWIKGINELRKQLPQDIQDILTRNEEAGTTNSKEYNVHVSIFLIDLLPPAYQSSISSSVQDAAQTFHDRYRCRVQPTPELFLQTFEEMLKDPTVYVTMNGSSGFSVPGSLKNWSIEADLHKIKVPTLLINGEYDGVQDESVLPYFNFIERVKWVKFANSSHNPQFEERERFIEVVGMFLTQ